MALTSTAPAEREAGILVSCRTFTGSTNAVLDASGGWGANAVAGGGGRIAVWYGTAPIPEQVRASLLAGQVSNRVFVTNQLATFLGTISVTNGSGGAYSPLATTGTVVFLEYRPPPAGTIISLH